MAHKESKTIYRDLESVKVMKVAIATDISEFSWFVQTYSYIIYSALKAWDVIYFLYDLILFTCNWLCIVCLFGYVYINFESNRGDYKVFASIV